MDRDNKDENLITKQSTTFNRYKNDYVHSKIEWKNNYEKKLHAKYYNEETDCFSFTDDKEVDALLNSAIKKDYSVFNKNNKNYRTELFSSLGYFEVFKIKGSEYFIDSTSNQRLLSLTVYNYEYNLKWLTLLSDLRYNYKIDIPLDIEEKFLTDVPIEINNSNIMDLAKFIDGMFSNSIQYHHEPFFEQSYSKGDFLSLTRSLFSRKQVIDSLFIENRNGIITELSNLFLNISTYEFMLIRDYTINSINGFVLQTSKLGFQWGYNPYKDSINSLDKVIRRNHSDEKLRLKNEIQNNFKPSKQIITPGNKVIKESILNTNLDNSKRFKDLFDSDELYDKAINILVDNKFISSDGAKLKWVFLETKEYKTKQTIIALCVVLITKHYFKNSSIAIYDNLKNEFNISIHKSTFSRSSNGFKRDYDKKATTSYNYISLFKDIL